jgi:HSP20 family molecular chaperone IbpA
MLTQQKRNPDREPMFERLKKQVSRGDDVPVIAPPVDIFESDNAVVLEVEMAGASKETIQTSVEGNKLEISARTAVPDLPREYAPLYSERQQLHYQRAFVLGVELQPDKIRASYDNGLLRLTIPKIEKAKPKVIAID